MPERLTPEIAEQLRRNSMKKMTKVIDLADQAHSHADRGDWSASAYALAQIHRELSLAVSDLSELEQDRMRQIAEA